MLQRRIRNKTAWSKFKATKGIEAKVKVFCKDFEQAGITHMSNRIKEAKKCFRNRKNL